MSVRASIGLPRACSGDMYCDVPRTIPASVCNQRAGDSFGVGVISGRLLD
jgi:hypothetical protein